jgi:hypothetical protein
MRRVNSSSGSGCWDDTRTRLPKRRPRSTVGSAISATSVNTARSVEPVAVGDVDGVAAPRGQGVGGEPRELHRGAVRRDARTAEDVGDDQVRLALRAAGQQVAGVSAAYPQLPAPVERELPADQLGEPGVDLDHLLPGAGTARGDVAGEGECAAAEVQGADGLARGRGEIGEVAEAALVLEGQVGRVRQVHVGLRRAVEQQRPGVGPVPVGEDLGQPGVDLFGDLRPAALLSSGLLSAGVTGVPLLSCHPMSMRVRGAEPLVRTSRSRWRQGCGRPRPGRRAAAPGR